MRKIDIIKTLIREFHVRKLPFTVDRNIKLPINSKKIISVVRSEEHTSELQSH